MGIDQGKFVLGPDDLPDSEQGSEADVVILGVIAMSESKSMVTRIARFLMTGLAWA